MLSLTITGNVCQPGSDLLCMLLVLFRLSFNLAGSMCLCSGVSAHACSAVLLRTSAIYSGSSASAWTAKKVRLSGQFPSKPKLSSSVFSAPWDRLALCSCSGKRAMRQEKSKGSQLAFIPCSLATENTNWKAGLKPFAVKNQVAVLRNQDQFTEFLCIFCAGHDQELFFHLSPTYSYWGGHFNYLASFTVTWTPCYQLHSVQPLGAKTTFILFRKKAAEATLKK